MTCPKVQLALSDYLDGALPAVEARAVAAHLAVCADCGERWRTLQEALEAFADLPRLPADDIASLVRDRLEVESRGPGLALLFRSWQGARPLILPSLVSAALVVMSVLGVTLAVDQARGTDGVRMSSSVWETRPPASGTEANPLFASTGVDLPQVRPEADGSQEALAGMGEGELFVETVVARDGSVATVTLLEGHAERAETVVEALRQQRFEPARYQGRPVAVSLYRLISRVEIRPPLT
jgi:anti-sigma factor RsiW